MLQSHLPWEEQDTLVKILRYHGVDDPDLTKHLAEFCNWIRADERAKGRFGAEQPPFLLVLLSQMGILTPKKKEPA